MDCPNNYECGCENCNLINNAECEIGVEYLHEVLKKEMGEYNKTSFVLGYKAHRTPIEGHGNFYDDWITETNKGG